MKLDEDAVDRAAQRLYKRFEVDMGRLCDWRDATEDDREEWRRDVRLVVTSYLKHDAARGPA